MRKSERKGRRWWCWGRRAFCWAFFTRLFGMRSPRCCFFGLLRRCCTIKIPFICETFNHSVGYFLVCEDGKINIKSWRIFLLHLQENYGLGKYIFQYDNDQKHTEMFKRFSSKAVACYSSVVRLLASPDMCQSALGQDIAIALWCAINVFANFKQMHRWEVNVLLVPKALYQQGRGGRVRTQTEGPFHLIPLPPKTVLQEEEVAMSSCARLIET